MHELSIALNIVDGVLEQLKDHEGAEVSAVHVRIGRLAGVDKEALLFSYQVACQDTVLEGSRLAIEELDVVIFCPLCKRETAIAGFPLLTCATCGAAAERVIHGTELEIIAMEVAS